MPYSLKLSNDTEAEAVVFISIGELAELAGRKRVTIRKLIENGIMPDANFRTPRCKINKGLRKGEFIEGYRLYSKDFLAPKLVKFLKEEVTQGKKITIEQRLKLIKLFQEERDYYLT